MSYQADFTTEDKVDIETIHRKVHGNEELRQVVDGDNTETNKRYKFDQVIDEILLDFVNSKLELYTKLSKPEVNVDLKRDSSIRSIASNGAAFLKGRFVSRESAAQLRETEF